MDDKTHWNVWELGKNHFHRFILTVSFLFIDDEILHNQSENYDHILLITYNSQELINILI